MQTVSQQLGLDKAWIEATFEELAQQIGLWPKLDEKAAINFFSTHKDDLRACQSFIEAHIWPNGIPCIVDLHLLDLPTMIGGSVSLDPRSKRIRMEVNEQHAKHPNYFLAVLAHEYAHVYHYFHANDLIIDAQISHHHHLTYECKTDLCTVLFGMGDIYSKCRTIKVAQGYLQAGYICDDLLNAGRKLYDQTNPQIRAAPTVPMAPPLASPISYVPPAPTGVKSRKPGFHRPAIPSPVPQPKGNRSQARVSPCIKRKKKPSPPHKKNTRIVRPSPIIQQKKLKGGRG